jgi:peptidoglycan hydrolase-like protein with peptidoglycan-binding domain
MTTSNSTQTVLHIGHTGARVQKVQQLLNQRGYFLLENGVFGADTEAAVRDFQVTRFLHIDAIVGMQTEKALYTGAPVDMPVLQLGSRGKEVRIVQVILANLSQSHDEFRPYYKGEIDSLYGPATEAAIKAFQVNSGLTPDGIVGDHTWYGLSKHGYLRYYDERGWINGVGRGH